MFRISLRGLLARHDRIALTVLAVALSSAFVSGALVVADTTSASFRQSITSGAAGVDAAVVAPGDAGTVLPPDAVRRASAVPGVLAASARLTVPVSLGGATVSIAGLPQAQAWPGAAPLNPFRLVQGVAPARPGDVVVDRGLATARGLTVGSTLELDATGTLSRYRVVGVAAYGSADSPPFHPTVLLSQPEALTLTDPPGWDAVLVRGRPGTDPEQLRTALARALGADPAARPASKNEQGALVALNGEQYRDQLLAAASSDLAFFTGFIAAFALVAFLVGAFVIANTFSILVSQRTRELALLRTLGATRRAVRRAVLLEGLILGAVAGTLGALAGAAVTAGLLAATTGAGVRLPTDAGVVVAPRAVLAGAALGLVVTVLAALGPAREAGGVSPMAALRATALPRPASRRRLITGGVVAALAALAATSENLAVIATFLAFVAVVLLVPVVLPVVLPALTGVASRLTGTGGRLAVANAVRNPRRTGSTVNALVVGVGLLVFLLVLGGSIGAVQQGGRPDPTSEQFLNLLTGLLLAALVIAAVGVTNTLVLSVLERRREIGLLRAVGMLARQVRTMLTTEAVVLAGIGTLLGAVLGVLLAAAYLRAVTFGAVPPALPASLVLVLLGGIALGVVAALLPARRALAETPLRALTA